MRKSDGRISTVAWAGNEAKLPKSDVCSNKPATRLRDSLANNGETSGGLSDVTIPELRKETEPFTVQRTGVPALAS